MIKVASRLTVYFGKAQGHATTEGNKQWGPTDGRNDADAWRVGVLFNGCRISCFPMAFAREQDALAASKSIERLIDWDGSFEEIRERVHAFGVKAIRRAMVEAMSW